MQYNLNEDANWASPVSNNLLWVVTWVWEASCWGMNKGSRGSQYCCWKKWLFSLLLSIPSLLLPQVFLCCLGNWSRNLENKSGQAKGLQSQWFPPRSLEGAAQRWEQALGEGVFASLWGNAGVFQSPVCVYLGLCGLCLAGGLSVLLGMCLGC